MKRPGWRVRLANIGQNRGEAVPALEKIPQGVAPKYLVWLTLVRGGAADLAVRDRRRALMYRNCAAGRPGGPGVERLGYTWSQGKLRGEKWPEREGRVTRLGRSSSKFKVQIRGAPSRKLAGFTGGAKGSTTKSK